MPGTRRGPQRLCRQLGAMQIPAANCCPAAAPCKPAARSSKPRGGFVQRQQAALGSVAASSPFPYSNAGGFWGPQHEIPQGRGAAGAQISASSPPQLEACINCRILVGECGKLPRALPGARCQRRLVAAPGTEPWAAGGREQLAAQGGALPTSPRHLLPSATVQPLPGPSRCCLPGGTVQAAPGMGLCHPPPSCRRRFWAQGAAVPWPGAVGGSPKKRGPAAARLPPRSRTGHPGTAQPRLSPVPPALPNPAHRAQSPAVPVPAGPLAPSARATAGSRRSPVLPGQPPSRLSPVPPGLPVPGIPHTSRSLSPTPPGVTTGPPALHAPCSALP